MRPQREMGKKRAGCLVLRAYHVVLAVKDEAADGLAACGGHDP